MTGTHGGLRSRWRRSMYPNNRPSATAWFLNRLSAIQFATGILAPRRAVTLEVIGRRSGRPISFPLVLVDYEGNRYLVSMLGTDVNWVRNVRAADGRAVLRHGRSEEVLLTEIDPVDRPPILRRYLELAPGARPHVPVDRNAPLEEFARIADQFPVFRVTPYQRDAPHA